jgi:ubiquinone/menaquinone biosynthesis C-methylase UbiE
MRRFLIRNWFQYLSTLDKEAHMTFMNLGYAPLDEEASFSLPESEFSKRYWIQMYHHVANAIDLNGLEVVEIGCGRGGGASYLMHYLQPKSVVGLDISQKAIEFCQRYYHRPGLSFLQGDAEALPFDSMSFDVIINIESSYGYGHIERFLQGAYRILRPQGYFLFADYRNREDIKPLRQHLVETGFMIRQEECINAQVLHALDLDDARKQKAIRQYVPRGLSQIFHYFAAMKGSKMYHALQSGRVDYRYFVLQKEGSR